MGALRDLRPDFLFELLESLVALGGRHWPWVLEAFSLLAGSTLAWLLSLVCRKLRLAFARAPYSHACFTLAGWTVLGRAHSLGLGLGQKSHYAGKVFVSLVLVGVENHSQVGGVPRAQPVLLLLHLLDVVVFLLGIRLNLVAELV